MLRQAFQLTHRSGVFGSLHRQMQLPSRSVVNEIRHCVITGVWNRNVGIFGISPPECRLPEGRQKRMEKTSMSPIIEFGELQHLNINSVGYHLPEVERESSTEEWQASSTLKKRRLKMNRHKYRKRRKRDRRRSK